MGSGQGKGVTRAHREFDRRQDRRRYQVSQESQTRGQGPDLSPYRAGRR
ncbi:hypothetical protein SBA3_2920012 [Candidatus Sulfopaludibacter sp. SbA3]|nr:hypothetical protein SBA3_2920012 [Candidatus Sulfopaludibacter sp. SbA3]